MRSAKTNYHKLVNLFDKIYTLTKKYCIRKRREYKLLRVRNPQTRKKKKETKQNKKTEQYNKNPKKLISIEELSNFFAYQKQKFPRKKPSAEHHKVAI